jgi:hypothetical protein
VVNKNFFKIKLRSVPEFFEIIFILPTSCCALLPNEIQTVTIYIYAFETWERSSYEPNSPLSIVEMTN